ncbi:cupin domain-containing protein [Streptomyces sp. NBC_01476]|uniref:cupin domain-containing protein n=1 Tax=Streptomyces sp. NBC_01476 TaxID=2903881 RepID=UPI002E2F8720|nr:cupin domain-containing protein [Streptomyces sp. NBC_01476]
MSDRKRVFLRGISSESYGLKEFRRAQLAAARVRDDSVVVATGTGAGYSSDHRDAADVRWRLAPGDEEFLTQTLQVHFVELPPHSENQGHGHQNEAAFYILEGAGYEIHDGLRYDWRAGDLAFVHTDSVHQHVNPYEEKAVCLVVKAKTTWMFLGLLQQGRGGPVERPEEFGEREDWSLIWTEGVRERKKIVRPEDCAWQDTPLGRVRVRNSPAHTGHRQFSVDVFELDVPAGSRSGRHWKMADEVLYVLDGAGYSLHWEVQEEIADRYHARIARTPTRHDITKGDTLYVPQNTVAQHFAADGTPLRLLSAQNRLFKHLGYDRVHYFEPAPPQGAS